MITKIANAIRGLVADMIEKAGSGHPGMPLGMAEAGTILYSEILRHHPAVPDWPDRDRFILSAGHGSTLLYALLHLTGYSLSLEELQHFRQLHSKTPGHPEYGVTAGIETTTGPLGQGLANGVGMALAERMLAATFNRPGYEIINHYTYVIAGDGCMMEGITSEASSLAGNLGLGKLIVIYDDNAISIEGDTELAFKESVSQRYHAYHWQVIEIDGHDEVGVRSALRQAQNESKKPSLIVAKTTIAHGSPMAGKAESHGAPLGRDNVKRLKKHLRLGPDEFQIDPEITRYFQKKSAQWLESYQQWTTCFNAWSEAHPDLKTYWDRIMARQLPEFPEKSLPVFEIGSAMSSRDAGGKVLNALATKLPELVGGSADLSPSTKTRLEQFEDVAFNHYHGRNIHFGVREHAMGGILNGLSLHGGFRVFGSTFLVFADYLRPALRLAALMGQPVIYVFTHDSFHVGEDGPTHQPVEQLESLRIIPNLQTIRPADANETAWAWLEALHHITGPTALVLSRQKLPILSGTSHQGFKQGGYIIKEAQEGAPELVVLASGSEVGLALAVAEQLESEGRKVRVLSIPCRERFALQNRAVRESLLGSDCLRVVIEAGVSNGWHQLAGTKGIIIGLDHFGLSGPSQTLAEVFGFTVEQVLITIKSHYQKYHGNSGK